MKNSLLVRVLLVVLAGAMAMGASACSLLFGPSYRDGNGVPTATATVRMSDLRVGDCLYNVSDSGDSITKMQVVPCTSSHEAEVYASQAKVANVTSSLQQYCQDQFKAYIGIDFNDSSLDVTFIHNDATLTTTDLKCIVYSQGNMVTTSYQGSQL